MTDAVVQQPSDVPVDETAQDAAATVATGQAGAVLFSELVWAHYWWEQERYARQNGGGTLERAFHGKLDQFQAEEGRIANVYWSTRAPSAVAMTVKERGRRRNRLRKLNPFYLLHERDIVVRLHRVSDWATRDTPLIADLLQQCDLLAIRAGEVLRGTSQRIAMRWILGVQAHLLGYIERCDGQSDSEREAEVVAGQQEELAKVAAYYELAANKAGRIVYLSGMLIGAGIVLALGGLAALPLWLLGAFEGPHAEPIAIVFLCFGAGAIGALVSAMTRMASEGKFNVDHELGRPLMRRLGVFRPAIGAVFGVALYALLASGLLQTAAPQSGRAVYFYGVAAFLAGFSERWAKVMFDGAQTGLSPAGASRSSSDESGVPTTTTT